MGCGRDVCLTGARFCRMILNTDILHRTQIFISGTVDFLGVPLIPSGRAFGSRFPPRGTTSASNTLLLLGEVILPKGKSEGARASTNASIPNASPDTPLTLG